MRSLILVLACPIACSFSGSSSAPDGDGDASTDGQTDAGAPCDPWGERLFFEPCEDSRFAPPETVAPVMIVADATYDTENDTFIAGTAPMVSHRFTAMVGGRMARVWLTEEFVLGEGITLRVVGSLPLLIAARLHVRITGRLDFDSIYTYDVNLAQVDVLPGAGQSRPKCADVATLTGESNTSGGAGGAGASFISAGSTSGGSDRGGTAAVSPAAVIPPSSDMFFAGGCRGGSGGAGNGGDPGEGGFGGGAVMISSIGPLQIAAAGEVFASGSGGYGQTSSGRNGAGGGGSGGMIVLEGPDVTVDGTVAANGGGGGGGANGNFINSSERSLLLAGQNGRCDTSAAQGAQGEGSDSGGDGAALDVPASPADVLGDRGGPGGGGGGGLVLLVAPDRASIQDGENTVSPQPLKVTPGFQPL